jgi:predicted nucleic acid-binding Zn ribbon protein
MTKIVKYRCTACGHRFEIPILSDAERLELQKKGQPVYAIVCTKCGAPDSRLQRY